MFSGAYDVEYHEFNAGAHRNTPKNLRAPLLVSHLGFWIEQSSDNARQREPDRVKCAVDAYILAFCRHARTFDSNLSLLPCVSGKTLLFATIVDPAALEKHVEPISSLTRRQTEIFNSGMRSVTIKFRWHDLDVTVRCEIHTELITLTTFVELDKGRNRTPFSSLEDLNKHVDTTLSYLAEVGDVSPSGDASNYFFEQFWEEWDAEFHSFLHVADEAGSKRIEAFEKVFADFRGVVFSEEAALFPDRRFFRNGRNPVWGEVAKQKLLPFLTAHASDRLRKYECAINYVLDGRGFMLTTLAPQLPEMPVEKRIPVRYVVFVHNRDHRGKVVVNKWQLGRLINLMHQLGTVRLAGLKDLKPLQEVGVKLAQIDHKVQKARESIAGKDDDALANIETTHNEFNGIVAAFLSSAGCSILYRIERSRYYVKQFNTGTTGLRIVRLQGDQPYDQFIERRLGAQFDFVDRLGVRYERTATSITMLDNNFLILKASKLDQQAIKVNAEIKTIQSYGEFILLIALVPYYISHLADLLIVKNYVPLATLIIWISFGTLAFWRKWRWEGICGAMIAVFMVAMAMAAFYSSNNVCGDFFQFCLQPTSPAASPAKFKQE